MQPASEADAAAIRRKRFILISSLKTLPIEHHGSDRGSVRNGYS
jgi:hypothetical protein